MSQQLDVKQTVAQKTSLQTLSAILLLAVGVFGTSTWLFGFPVKKKPLAISRTLSVSLPKPGEYSLETPRTPQQDAAVKTLKLAGAVGHTMEIGKPSIPLVRRMILLPPDVAVEGVEIVVNKQTTVTLTDRVAPVQPSQLPNPAKKTKKQGKNDIEVFKDPPVAPDAQSYASNKPYPQAILQKYTPDRWGHLDVLSLSYTPLQYTPAANTLTITTEATVKIVTRKGKPFANRRALARDYITAQARQELLNASSLTAWYGTVSTPQSTPEDIDLAVIRPDLFVNELPLAEGSGKFPLPHRGTFAITDKEYWVVGWPMASPYFNNVGYRSPAGTITNINLVAQENGQKAYLESVAGLANGTVVTVGYAGNRAVIFTRLPGQSPTTFSQVTLPAAATDKYFSAVAELDPNNSNSGFWVVGGTTARMGVVYHATDITNPNTWTQVTVPTTPRLRAVYASGSKVWAVGDGGTILHYDGSAWSLLSSGVTQELRSIDGSGPTDIWVVGTAQPTYPFKGTILHYNGSSWENRSNTNPDQNRNNLNVVQVFDSQHVWVGGTGSLFMTWHVSADRWIHQYLTHLDDQSPLTYQDIAVLSPTNILVFSDVAGPFFQLYEDTDVLDQYLAFRRNQGYRIEVKSFSAIVGEYPGTNLYERIQAYLLDRYTNSGLSHALLIGSSRLIPNNGDYSPYWGNDDYYRQLIGDFGTTPELFVSRIPRDGSTEIEDFIQRVIAEETRSDPYLNNVLLSSTDDPSVEGELCRISPGGMEQLKVNYFLPRGFNVTTLYEPNPEFIPTDTLSPTHMEQRWTTEHPHIVSMTAHGNPSRVDQTWSASQANNLDNTYPSHVWVGDSCSTADPEVYNNVGQSLIRRGAISYVGAITFSDCEGESGKQEPFYNHFLYDGQSIAEAYNQAIDITGQRGVQYPETLFGDPLTSKAGMSSNVLSYLAPVSRGVYRAVSSIDIVGSVLGPNFQSYAIEWGQGANPASWSTTGITLNNPTAIKVTERLATWDTTSITNTGPYTLRITGTYNGQPVSHQITFTIDNQACADATQPQQCSTTKPKLCENGQLQDRCSVCGCANASDTCTYQGSCIRGCVDGTPANSCSTPSGSFCNGNSQLHNLSTECASKDEVAHTNDDCNLCGFNGTYCSTAGSCSQAQPQFGLLGDYFEGQNFDTLRSENVPDPVIDFGPSFLSDTHQYFETLINQRVGDPAVASIRWDGFIKIETTEPITYYVSTNAPTTLYVGDLTTPLLTTGMNNSAQKSLTLGWHPIGIEYQQSSDGPAALQLGWKVNGLHYFAEMGGFTSPIKLRYIIPHESLATTIPPPPTSGGGEEPGEDLPPKRPLP